MSIALTVAACGGGSNTTSTPTTVTTPKRATPVAVTESQLKAVAASRSTPIYWAGPASGTYELTLIADGRTYVRYLPAGVPVGSPSLHLTIGTYLRPVSPYNTVKAAAEQKHATIRFLRDGSLAVVYHRDPRSVFLVFPGKLYEVEVYDPSAAKALALAMSGKVVPLA